MNQINNNQIKMNQVSQNYIKMNQKIVNNFIVVNNDFRKTIDDTSKTLEQADASMSKSFKETAASFLEAFPLGQVADFGVAVAKMGIEYNSTLEQSRLQWNNLLGTQEQAKSMLNDITNFAAKSPFSKMGVEEMAKQLHDAGFAGDDLFVQLTKFGDMGSAFNIQEDGLKQLVNQYAQVQNAGVAYLDDLNSLKDNGVPIYEALSEVLGISIEEVQRLGSEGKISADMYNQAMEGIATSTAGSMDAQSQTFGVMMSNLNEGLLTLAGILTEGLFAALKWILEPITELIQKFIEVYTNTGSITEAFFSLTENMGILGDIFSILGEIFTVIWETYIQPIFTLFIQIIEQLVDVFQKHFPTMQGIFEDVVKIISQTWEDILKPVFGAIESYIENILLPVWVAIFKNGIVPLIDWVFNRIGIIWNEVLKPILQGIIDFIGGVFSGDWARVWEGVIGIFTGIWNSIKNGAKQPINDLIDMINKLINGLNKIKLPDWLGGFSINIPTIPRLWRGSNFTMGGLTLVGELGPELVSMPRGSRVLPAHKTRSVLNDQGIISRNFGVNRVANIYVELDGRTIAKATGAELVDMVRLKTGLAL